jgi:hypothetical protein
MKTLPSIALFSNLLFRAFDRKAFVVFLLICCWTINADARPCEPPSGTRISNVLSTKMTVSWDDDGNPAPVRVSYAEYPGNSFIYKETQGNTYSIDLIGLRPSTQYIVRVNRMCDGEPSVTLSMGIIRTLSVVEEETLCENATNGELCATINSIMIGERGENYIDLVIPNLYLEGHTFTHLNIAYSPPNTPWIVLEYPLVSVNNTTIRLEGLSSNTLYFILVDLGGAKSPFAYDECYQPGIYIPTYGPDYIGPIFTQIPPNLTLDCSAPKPYNIDYPIISGGCSTPRITFTDEEVGDGCNRELIRRWTAVDDCGRQSTVKQTISFQDTEPPRFLDLPLHNAIVECGHAIPSEEPTAVDNCGDVKIIRLSDTQEGPDCNYTIKRTWIATDLCGNSASYIEVIEVHQNVDESTGNDPDVPPLPVACGVAFTPTAITNQQLLANPSAGQLWDIAGFPVLVTEIISATNGVLSGVAKVRLPFGQKVVYAEFYDAKVNTDNKIFAGTLRAISGDFVIPTGGDLNIGGDICIPDPPIPPFGFNNNGQFILHPPYDGWAPGDPVDPIRDPNGFDVNGNSVDNGTPYNNQGCNQEGLNANGDTCSLGSQGAYYWLQENEGGTTAEGIAYANFVKNSIRQKVIDILNQLIQENSNLIATQRASCATIRTGLESSAANLDQSYLFGQNKEFINEGMYLKFSSAPINLSGNINVANRTAQIVQMEGKHIDLYHCDKTLHKYIKTIELLNFYLGAVALDTLINEMLYAIKRLPADKINGFRGNENLFLDWLKTFINDKINAELISQGYVYQQTSPVEKIHEFSPPTRNIEKIREFSLPNNAQYLAMVGDETNELLQLAIAQSFETTEDDLKFQFDQGWEMVGNTDRAFYLEAIAKARGLRTTANINGYDPESLQPIKVDKEVSGRTYTMLLDDIKFTIAGASLNAYFILDIPNTGQRIVFKASGVTFNPSGISIGNAQLKLTSNINIRLNNTAKLIIKGAANQTYVNWDCSGFAGMSVDAEIEFCRNYLSPLNSDLEVEANLDKRVRASFITSMPAWGEFITTINMDRFALTKHPDYKWRIVNASLDFSETTNPSTLTDISANYASEFKQGNQLKPQWKGFYLENLEITLPKKFNKDNPTPVTIAARNILIDDRGLTGLISVITPIIPLSQGNLSGWPYSMEKISIAVVANRIQGGEFEGLINVPIFSSAASNNTAAITPQDCFHYTAKIISTEEGEYYEFAVTPNGALNVDIWKATATLTSNSFLNINYANDKFTILANLTGQISIGGNISDDTRLDLPGLAFQNIVLSNEAPYFRSGTFGLGASAGINFGGFALTVNLPKLLPATANSTTTSFSIGAGLSLVQDASKGLAISAKTALILNGEMVTINGRQRWKYKELSKVFVSLSASWKGVEKAHGELYWEKNNPIFGRVFKGTIGVQFTGLKKPNGGSGVAFDIKAMALFGKVDNYRYFMIDALVQFSPGIPISAITLTGFGGGAYYHMNRDTTAFVGLSNAPSTVTLPTDLGASLSGIVYRPTPDPVLGIKASVLFEMTGQAEAFNGGVSFEIVFNGSSIERIGLNGAARLMAKVVLGDNTRFGLPVPSNANPFVAKVNISYVFPTNTLHGELNVFANVFDVFVGAGTGNLVGKAEVHFEPTKWYINIGTPNQRLGFLAKFKVPVSPPIDIQVAVSAYLCIGTTIPPMPELPSYVRQMTGAQNFMANESRRATGKGFAFGASIEVNTGDIEFLIFYAGLHAGLGYDIMLQKYGDITCSNNNNRPLGINGWYASGQAYSFIEAKIGILYKNVRFDILNIGAAAALQVKLPNPFWARGAVGGQYRILGGLVKGNCNFKFTLGKSCDTEAAEDGLAYIKLIEEIEPSDNSEAIDVTAKPTAFFGVQMGTQFDLTNNDGENQTYTTTLLDSRLYKVLGTTENEIPINRIWSEDKYKLTYKTYSFLEGFTKYKVYAKVKCEGPGVNKIEEKTIFFTTTAAPRVIPATNIESSYPLNGMYNVYRTERNKGYIQLKDAQAYLLYDDLKVRFSTKDGTVAEVPATAVNGSHINFDFPGTLLPANKVYRMDLIALREIYAGGGSGSSTGNRPNGPNADWDASEDEFKEDILYQLYFRTSQYNTFQEKITMFNTSAYAQSSFGVMKRTILMEPFDRIEIEGTSDIKPLIQHNPGSSPFLTTVTTLYEQLKIYGYVPSRGIQPNGSLIPSEFLHVSVVGDTNLRRITITDFNNGPTANATSCNMTVLHELYRFASYDFLDFRSKAYNAVGVESSCMGGYNNPNNVSTDYNCDAYSDNNPPTQPQSQLWSIPHCCCSPTYLRILDNNVQWPQVEQLYFNLSVPVAAAGSIHPVLIKYQLPDGQPSTVGTTINFRY